MKKAAIYIRVSSEQQVKEGDSIAAQMDALRKYVDERPDLLLAGEYLDDGISGQKYRQRDELQRLLDDVRGGKIDIICFTRLDRWFRSVRHYTATQDILDRYGVAWLAIWEPIYDTTTPSGRLIVNQMMSIAQFEAENTGQRIRQVQAYKVTQGEVISGSTPAGYEIVDKHLRPNQYADNVREAFHLYASIGNMNEVQRRLSSLPGMPRTRASVKKMLKNPLYIGEYRGNANYCEPIITRSLFEDVQRKLSMNIKSSQKNTYIFSGLIRCAECGCAFGGNLRRRVRGECHSEIYQYRCPKYYNQKLRSCTNKKVLNENVLERHLLAYIRPLIQDHILQSEIRQRPSNEAKNRIESARKRINKLKELYLNDLITINEYKADKERYLQEIAELEKAVNPDAGNLDELRELLKKDIEGIYQTFDKEEKRLFWRGIVKEIRFGLDKKIEVIFL